VVAVVDVAANWDGAEETNKIGVGKPWGLQDFLDRGRLIHWLL